MTLREQIDGARLVMAHNDAELTLAWHGGHGIRVYNDLGDEVDYFISCCSEADDADPEDVRAAMREYSKEVDDDIHESD